MHPQPVLHWSVRTGFHTDSVWHARALRLPKVSGPVQVELSTCDFAVLPRVAAGLAQSERGPWSRRWLPATPPIGSSIRGPPLASLAGDRDPGSLRRTFQSHHPGAGRLHTTRRGARAGQPPPARYRHSRDGVDHWPTSSACRHPTAPPSPCLRASAAVDVLVHHRRCPGPSSPCRPAAP